MKHRNVQINKKKVEMRLNQFLLIKANKDEDKWEAIIQLKKKEIEPINNLVDAIRASVPRIGINRRRGRCSQSD